MKPTRTTLFALISLCGAALTGCETTATEPAQASESHLPVDLPPPTDRCFYTRNIDGFEVLDERTLIVRERRNRAYLVRFSHRCAGLQFAGGIGFDTRDQRVCGNRPETLLIHGRGIPGRCMIATIHEGSRAEFLGDVEDWQRGETTEHFPELDQDQAAEETSAPEPLNSRVNND